jgi:hypothetical protein
VTLKPKIKAAMARSRSGIYARSVFHRRPILPRGRLAEVRVEVGTIFYL